MKKNPFQFQFHLSQLISTNETTKSLEGDRRLSFNAGKQIVVIAVAMGTTKSQPQSNFLLFISVRRRRRHQKILKSFETHFPTINNFEWNFLRKAASATAAAAIKMGNLWHFKVFCVSSSADNKCLSYIYHVVYLSAPHWDTQTFFSETEQIKPDENWNAPPIELRRNGQREREGSCNR